MGQVALTVEDFLAYMPTGEFIHVASRKLWPAKSVDANVPEIDTGQLNDKGKPVTIKASRWLLQNQRIAQMVWAPGYPEIIEGAVATDGGFVNHPSSNLFNTYREPTINWSKGDPERAQRWVDLVDYLYPDHSRRLIQWFAARVQRPDLKINHAVVAGGNPGVGKDTLLAPVVQAVGPWNVLEIAPSALTDKFNGYMKSVIVRVSEVYDLGDTNRYAFHERTKTLCVAPPDMVRVNEKHTPETQVMNVTGAIMTTNHRVGAMYLPMDDRRHLVLWSEATRAQIVEDLGASYFDDLWAWYKNGGFEDVAAYLHKLDPGDFSRTDPPIKTQAFLDMVHAEGSTNDAELADVLDKLERPVAVTIPLLLSRAEGGFHEWLADRKNNPTVGRRLGKLGYVSVPSDADDGFWVVSGEA